MINLHRLFIATLVSAISACSSLPPPTAGEQHWLLQGRIGLWQGQQQESSQIRWLQCGSHDSTIRLSGPMGVGGADIRSTAAGAELHYKGEVKRADSAEALAADIGWPVPVTALRHWLRGKAAPGAALSAELSPTGQLSTLQQHGWQIRFSRYQNDRSTALPQLIDARRGDTRIKLLVSNWANGGEDCPND